MGVVIVVVVVIFFFEHFGVFVFAAETDLNDGF